MYLAIQYSANLQELPRDLALNLVRLARILDPAVAAYPPHVPHRRVDALDVELILQAYRQPMQGPRCPAVFGLVIV